MDPRVMDKLTSGIEFERNRKGPPAGFPQLPDIPAGRYTDPDFLALERERVWQKAWLYAAHLDEFPEAGSYKLWQRNGSPILILRDRHDECRAFYNICRHRGGPLVRDDVGTLQGGLVCGYHGWTYDLEGKLVNLRDRRDFTGLDASCRNLIPVRCERLGNWIFINEDPDAPELAAYLGPIHDYFRALPLESLRLVSHETFQVNCNVKIMLEGFLEVYHLKSVHPATVDRFLDHRGTNIILWHNGHSLMLIPNRRPDWVDPGARGMPEMSGTTDFDRQTSPSFNFYPNLITPLAPSGIPFNVLWPRTRDTAILEVIWFAPGSGDERNEPLWATRRENYNRILDEDMRLVEKIQVSMDSPGMQSIPLSYQERRIYHWHTELDRRIGTDRVPEHLRVAPILDDWTEEGWA
jgi:phenylpropionate dioxygenase-like ring-hydroxylating dioxygenase large terminal subunit